MFRRDAFKIDHEFAILLKAKIMAAISGPTNAKIVNITS